MQQSLKGLLIDDVISGGVGFASCKPGECNIVKLLKLQVFIESLVVLVARLRILFL